MARDNNRGIHATTVMGDDRAAEGAVEVGSLSAASGSALAGNLSSDSGRQPMPNPNLHDDGVYPFTSGGDTDRGFDASDGHMKDDDYPSVPNVSLPGGSGTTNAGQQGSPVDWNSVAPYEYPDFGKMPSPKNRGVLPKIYD